MNRKKDPMGRAIAEYWKTKTADRLRVFSLITGTGVPQDERKGLKWIHKSTFQGYQPAIDYCKEHGYKWY